MNVTNNGKKIVNIGELALLPGMTAPLPKSYEGNPVVGFLIERGTLSCDQPFCSKAVAETTLRDDAAEAVAREEAAARAAKEAADKAAKEAAARAAQEAADRVAVIEEQVRAIKKMNRGELDAACAEQGIEVEEGDTIPTLQKKLIEKLQEG
ncbi:MAG: hypothetical protein KH446_02920 [Oscillibacter sp.]|uniref:hypothetical protein n=1 Tax=Oscillibacter sp. TaxID=1945593 RepID=UPI001D45FE3F|nr:hypothetical protein [Oscillibacter sp.]MBS6290649.1 hypothetical protein [Oscillibacter sp.]